MIAKVSFYLPNISTDVIDTIGAGTYNATAQTIVNSDRRFWIENDIDGDPHLCTTAGEGMPLRLGYNTTMVAYAMPFTLIEDLGAARWGGGHPPYVPRPQK